MLRLKYWIKDFFGFSRSQVNGFVILLLLTIAALFSEPCWRWWMSQRQTSDPMDRILLDSLVNIWTTSGKTRPDSNDIVPHNRFRFNPNTVSLDSLMALGFSPITARRIVRYREKGGQFRIKRDVQKIYGVDSSFYHEIYTFIDLPERNIRVETKHKTYQAKEPVSVNKRFERFDINTADTAQLKKIYGIGDKLAMRILKYRNALGGFVALDQLREVYGLDSMVVGRLLKAAEVKPDFKPTKININVAAEKQLAAHPYLSKVAKAIVSYRFQYGAFKTVSEIGNISSLDETTIQKVTPYLVVNDEL